MSSTALDSQADEETRRVVAHFDGLAGSGSIILGGPADDGARVAHARILAEQDDGSRVFYVLAASVLLSDHREPYARGYVIVSRRGRDGRARPSVLRIAPRCFPQLADLLSRALESEHW